MKMKLKNAQRIRLAQVLLGITILVALVVVRRTRAQGNAEGHAPVHMTTDWSNRHMIYSAPSSMAQAWRLQAEPRYVHQWTRRNAATVRNRQ
jgi:hypothetical protein